MSDQFSREAAKGFGAMVRDANFMQGIKRMVNNPRDFAASREQYPSARQRLGRTMRRRFSHLPINE
jgi:hypothetical protein